MIPPGVDGCQIAQNEDLTVRVFPREREGAPNPSPRPLISLAFARSTRRFSNFCSPENLNAHNGFLPSLCRDVTETARTSRF